MKLTDVPTVVLVASGKGGVGKTRTSVDLAQYLTEQGHTVGYLDADISTPNAPEVLGGDDFDVGDQPLSDGEHLLPVEVDGVHVFSQGLELRDDVALLRDANWRANALSDYIHTVEWPDDTEYVVVDSPPGNGSEVQLTIAEVEPDFGYLVTTGAVHSARDTRRTHELFKQADVPHAVILNMRRAIVDVDLDGVRETIEDMRGIGENRADTILDAVADAVAAEPVQLHDDDIDMTERIDAEVVADVPFTTDAVARLEALAPAADRLPQPMEVEPDV